MPRPKRATTTPAPTRLARLEFAFFKGYLLGLEPGKLSNLYLPPGVDYRVALTAIQDRIIMQAHRQGRHAEARLLRIPPTALAENIGSAPLPTLAEYAQKKDPSGNFFTESDLAKLYLEDYPHAKFNRRSQRARLLRDRQLARLHELETSSVVDPLREDLVGAWFEPALAKRLAKVGITHIDILIGWVESYGFRWWTRVPRLGAKGAAKIIFWLENHAELLDVKLGARSLMPRRKVNTPQLDVDSNQRTTSLVPLERFKLPAALDGSQGINRADRNLKQLKADDDYAAILEWLAARGSSHHTTRSYRKEAERLLMWAICERGVPLSSFRVEDCGFYLTFLATLGSTDPNEWTGKIPQADWIAPRSTDRLSPRWRPFDGPLSEASQKQAKLIVQSLFQFWADASYINGNPWRNVKIKASANNPSASNSNNDTYLTTLNARRREVDIGVRSLSEHQWQAVLGYVAGLEESMAQIRLAFILLFAYGTGLRASELVTARTGALTAEDGKEENGKKRKEHWLYVLGKGSKMRKVPMTHEVMGALSQYLAWRELPADPYACDPETRLIAPLANETIGEGISGSWLYGLLKATFEEAAKNLSGEDRAKLKRASTHWLRHTSGSHQVRDDVPLVVVQQNFGHASLKTTGQYAQQEATIRHKAVTEFMKKRVG